MTLCLCSSQVKLESFHIKSIFENPTARILNFSSGDRCEVYALSFFRWRNPSSVSEGGEDVDLICWEDGTPRTLLR